MYGWCNDGNLPKEMRLLKSMPECSGVMKPLLHAGSTMLRVLFLISFAIVVLTLVCHDCPGVKHLDEVHNLLSGNDGNVKVISALQPAEAFEDVIAFFYAEGPVERPPIWITAFVRDDLDIGRSSNKVRPINGFTLLASGLSPPLV
jgi:hypothetical protein